MADDTTAGPTTAVTPGAPARIDLDVVRGLIGAARTRLRMQGALEGAVTSSIVASASALGAVFLVRKELISPQLGIGLLIGSAGLIGVGAIVGALGRLDDEQVARKIDRASGLADRLSSAVAFERALATAAPDDADTADLMRAAMRDAAAAAPRANVKAATPLRQPTDTRPALAFLVVAALAASLGIKMPPTEPELLRAAPEAGRRGSEVAIIGERLCGPRKDPAVACALDGALVYAHSDPNAGKPASIQAAAYTYNKVDEKITTNFAIDTRQGVLVTQGSRENARVPVSPNTGRLFTVGALGVGPIGKVSFDIAAVDNAAMIAVAPPGGSRSMLHLVDLATGATKRLGTIGSAGIRGIAIEP